MTDKHLNLFYTYNRDNELIEDNLTRAFILTLSLLSSSTLQIILTKLLTNPPKTHSGQPSPLELDYTGADFALQNNLDESIPPRVSKKILLSISTEPLEDDQAIKHVDTHNLQDMDDSRLNRSRPDAWIYDSKSDYCILIESKCRSYPLDIDQLRAHSRDWFGIQLKELAEGQMYFSKTWIDVLEVFNFGMGQLTSDDSLESGLLDHMCHFLSFYGYQLFRGIQFQSLDDPPKLVLNLFDARNNYCNQLDVSRLQELSLNYSFIAQHHSS